MERLDDETAHAYLDLLGVDARRGEVDGATLVALQRAHVERVPWETVDIVRGAPPGIERLDSVRRVLGGRGGYCFHLNGAFSTLLEWLGVETTRHLAGVQGRADEEPPGANGNHLGLTARTCDGREWLVDVGLGDGPHEPVPLAAGVHEQDGFRYGLGPSACEQGGWRFEHDPSGVFVGFDVAAGAAETRDFARMHHLLSTTRFAQVVTAQRWRDGRIEVLRGCTFSEVGPGGVRATDVTDGGEWWELLVSHYGLAYGDLPGEEREALWRRTLDGHRAWEAAGRP